MRRAFPRRGDPRLRGDRSERSRAVRARSATAAPVARPALARPLAGQRRGAAGARRAGRALTTESLPPNRRLAERLFMYTAKGQLTDSNVLLKQYSPLVRRLAHQMIAKLPANVELD